MFSSIFNIIVSYLSSSYLLPLWYSCTGLVLVGAATVFLKNLFESR